MDGKNGFVCRETNIILQKPRSEMITKPKKKCIIILSNKSSGSSAFQNILLKYTKARSVSKTRHFQNETLYWTKAASVLGLSQNKMLDSEVPIEYSKAKRDLVTLLSNNIDNYQVPKLEKDIIFQGWLLLCKQYSPIFLEKSPHHLFQWSALQLIIECMDKLKDIALVVFYGVNYYF